MTFLFLIKMDGKADICNLWVIFECVVLYGDPIYLLQIILSQEKNIQRLNELVRSLREQLLQCRGIYDTRNGTVTPLTENVYELERQQILED